MKKGPISLHPQRPFLSMAFIFALLAGLTLAVHNSALKVVWHSMALRMLPPSRAKKTARRLVALGPAGVRSYISFLSGLDVEEYGLLDRHRFPLTYAFFTCVWNPGSEVDGYILRQCVEDRSFAHKIGRVTYLAAHIGSREPIRVLVGVLGLDIHTEQGALRAAYEFLKEETGIPLPYDAEWDGDRKERWMCEALQWLEEHGSRLLGDSVWRRRERAREEAKR